MIPPNIFATKSTFMLILSLLFDVPGYRVSLYSHWHSRIVINVISQQIRLKLQERPVVTLMMLTFLLSSLMKVYNTKWRELLASTLFTTLIYAIHHQQVWHLL